MADDTAVHPNVAPRSDSDGSRLAQPPHGCRCLEIDDWGDHQPGTLAVGVSELIFSSSNGQSIYLIHEQTNASLLHQLFPKYR